MKEIDKGFEAMTLHRGQFVPLKCREDSFPSKAGRAAAFSCIKLLVHQLEPTTLAKFLIQSCATNYFKEIESLCLNTVIRWGNYR
jgi:hypothetical protein